MIPLLITPDLRDACPNPACFPGDHPAVLPYRTVSSGATLRADYRCPCGMQWPRWWSAGDTWPASEAA